MALVERTEWKRLRLVSCETSYLSVLRMTMYFAQTLKASQQLSILQVWNEQEQPKIGSQRKIWGSDMVKQITDIPEEIVLVQGM